MVPKACKLILEYVGIPVVVLLVASSALGRAVLYTALVVDLSLLFTGERDRWNMRANWFSAWAFILTIIGPVV